jgi:hypothetical protein
MQRITWSGIALHGGPLPGYPASHGCVRMPFDFAERLFDATRLGLRVIVAPTDVAPVEIAHPVLFQAKPGAGALTAARTAEADEATSKAVQARLAAVTASREAAQAMVPVRVVENQKRRAEAQLLVAETAPGSAIPGEAKERAESDKAQAVARVAELQAQLIGTHIFTAMERDAKMRWSVVSLEGGRPRGGVVGSQGRTGGGHGGDVEPMLTDPASAKSALDRIVIPQDALYRIVGVAPRSSLIVTDEALSSETGKGTDFVVLLSGEPQGGVNIRRRGPEAAFGYARPRDRLPDWRSPFVDRYSTR